MKNENSIQTKLMIGLFIAYLIILTWIILFKMSFTINELPNLRGLNLIPLKGSVIVNGQILMSEIINNILAFVPVGIYFCMTAPQWSFIKKAFSILGISFLYELLQFIFAIGASDITDLIGNTLGGIIGIGLYFILYKILKEKTNRIITIMASIATICLIGFLALIILVNN